MNEVSNEIVRNGSRWAANILTEIMGNYGKQMPHAWGVHMRAALTSLNLADLEVPAPSDTIVPPPLLTEPCNALPED